MGNYEIRAVTKLNLDSVKEKDIIEEIQSLIEHRKFGNYITNLLRFAAEHRDDLEDLGFNGANRGVVDTRKKMLNEYKDELNALKLKIDCIFDIALALRSAFEIGHVTALESQVDNIIAAQIVAQTQMNKLKRALGDDISFVFKDSGDIRRADIEKAAKEAADLALVHYGNEISDLAAAFNSLKNEYSHAGYGVDDYIARNLRIAGTGFEKIEGGLKDTETAKNSSNGSSGDDSKNSGVEVGSDDQTTLKSVESTNQLKFDGDMDALSSFFGS